MGDDAHHESQYAQVTPQTAELREFVAGLAAEVAALKAEQDRQDRIAEILDSGGGPPPPPRRKRRPNPHNLHIVPGCALLAAGAAWLVRARARRFAAGAATAALLTGGTLAPDLVQPVPAAQKPVHDFDKAVHHHHATVPVTPAATLPPRRRRRVERYAVRPGGTAAPSPSASPAPTGEPVPAPSPTVIPDPGPTIPVPVPTPVPTCTNLTGKHCHPGDLAADAPGVLGGLPRLPWVPMAGRR